MGKALSDSSLVALALAAMLSAGTLQSDGGLEDNWQIPSSIHSEKEHSAAGEDVVWLGPGQEVIQCIMQRSA